ncbi:hypothetical protein RFI_11120 [Reticulomyxa filosa]|uniref:Uncharacterized protein n=1 Tax=Reticulomyxa filosa TaxID=46433 RepID=X6NJC6_RETFI|nr:hypothetical protein RFI_11120 [Reticulomyxa filosa]|eukprot:ETO26018.1 hypothetical protein RFI_11120 [Reticulomyxa filosa]
MAEEHVILPSKEQPKITSEDWPLLLKVSVEKIIKSVRKATRYSAPKKKKKEIKISQNKNETKNRYGVINLDKPPRPSSHEVVTWVKNALKELQVEKTGHSGTLDPQVSGNLLVTIDRGTRLVKSQQNAGKEYVGIIRLHGKVERDQLLKALRKLQGPIYQRPPILSAVARRLRVRTIHWCKLLEYNEERGLAVVHISCQAGTYIRTLCIHVGMLCGVGAHMQELRRVRSGHLGERDNMVTMHDVLDAAWLYRTHGDESYLRRVVMPLEVLLTHYKRIIVKDSSVNAICYGGKIMIPGLLRFDSNIEMGEEIVVVTTKGEAVCLANAQMTSNQMGCVDHGVVAKIKRVIMDRDKYPRKWGLGPHAIQKQKMIQTGTLDKHGKPNQLTPKEWTDAHPDYSKSEYAIKQESDPSTAYLQQQTETKTSKKRSASQMDLDAPPTKKVKVQKTEMDDEETEETEETEEPKEKKKRKEEKEKN